MNSKFCASAIEAMHSATVLCQNCVLPDRQIAVLRLQRTSVYVERHSEAPQSIGPVLTDSSRGRVPGWQLTWIKPVNMRRGT